ncbi:hypothetical protein EDC45_0003 [Mesocricetibacter intestinalis]|uniref:Uncharacterized protein n=1 Tax=Mesocricetibacter intestinalis TaxID=1521930 RepID=A0A4R6VBT5_9PAST|nr:DUF5389 domain-containing protein [Mesocricetibacter intestinalis]TDQ59356.1 hypothetical protein EDC45_0003 [Mesocricetibacter intestinalis]
MENKAMPEKFSRFSWALAGFCLPVLLWPLALLISPSLLKNPGLSDFQLTSMSVFLWIYPFLLAITARILFKLHKRKPHRAKQGLIISAVVFYAFLFYLVSVGFSV